MVQATSILREKGQKKSSYHRLTIRTLAFFRKWRQLFRETIEILSAFDAAVLVLTHILFVFAEDLLTNIGLWIWGTFPREINPPGWRQCRGTLLLAPGLQQTPFSSYPMGWFLSHVFGWRVLLLQTGRQGNYEPFETTVALNQWIHDEVGSGPLVGIGFSKGGQDLAWLFSAMLINDPKRRLALVMMSTPVKGTPMARVVKTKGAQALLPDTPEIRQTKSLIEALHQGHVHIAFYGAIWDRIVRRSDSRTDNDQQYRPPSWKERLRGVKRDPPWYWSRTLWFQFGHTAIYNPIAWFQVGWYVTHQLPRL